MDQRASNSLRWILLIALLASSVLPQTGLNPGLSLVVGELPVIIAIWHFASWVGWRMALLGFLVVYVVAFSFEFAGTHTGLVFGSYFYSPTAIGPLVGEVPVLLPLGYFAMGYGAYVVTRLMLRNIGEGLTWVGVLVTALMSSLVMTLIDLASDPIASTLLGKWTWEDGGSYFGVPVHNYLGWLATTFTFFLIITILMNRSSMVMRQREMRPMNFYAQAIVLYGSYGLGIVLNPFLGRTGEIYDAMAMVAGLTMTIPILVAASSLGAVQRASRSS